MVKRLRQGYDVETTIGEVLGTELAAALVHNTRCATLRNTARGDSRRAVTPIGPEPRKSENAPDVRRVAMLLVLICSWMRPRDVRGRPGKRTGHHGQAAALSMSAIGRRLALPGEDRERLGEREIERYLALLRTAGILRNWQPPASSKNDKGHLSGHCFQLYELPEMPRELQQALASWHRAGAAATPPPAAAPARPPTVEHDADAADAALSFVRGLVPY